MENQMVVVGLPKSANVFVNTAIAQSTGAEEFTLCTRACLSQQIMPDVFSKFIDAHASIGGQHFPATDFNMNILEQFGVTKIALLVRDPRDAMVSWAHHINRPDIRNSFWPRALTAAGLQSANYYSLPEQERLVDLSRTMFPAMQRWLGGWANVITYDRRFVIHVTRYEDFVVDKNGAVAAILQFFGYDKTPILPTIGSEREAGIETSTHFRRGQIGSYRDEASGIPFDVDHFIYARFGWPVDQSSFA